MSDAGYRDPERPDVFVVPLDPNRDPLEQMKPPLLGWLYRKRSPHPPLRVEIGGDNVWLRAENGDALGDRNAGTLAFSPACVSAPGREGEWCPGWFVRHRGGTQLIATYVPELLFPGAPAAMHDVAYWLGSGDFRAIRSALYPT